MTYYRKGCIIIGTEGGDIVKRIKKGILITIIILPLLVLLYFNEKQTQKAVENCINKGYSKNYCISKLS